MSEPTLTDLQETANFFAKIVEQWQGSVAVFENLVWNKIDLGNKEHAELLFSMSSMFFHGAIYLQTELTKFVVHITSINPPLIGSASIREAAIKHVEDVINTLTRLEKKVLAYFDELYKLVDDLIGNGDGPRLDS
jgi:hypothetical protein